MNQQLNISPMAILAAVLANADETRKVRIKPEDASPVQEVEIPVVRLEKRGDAIVCESGDTN